MKNILMILSLTLTFASSSFASSSCAGLKAELRAMQEAQTQIMKSLVNNHESFASSLEEYSDLVAEGSSANKQISSQMSKTAVSFRTRGVQGKKIAAQLEKATKELVQKVVQCL